MLKNTHISVGILIFMVSILLSGCQTRSNSDISQEIIPLSGTIIHTPESFLGGACEVVAGDVFAFQSFDPDYRFITASFSGDTLIEGVYLCPSGQGPGEYLKASLLKNTSGQLSVLGRESSGDVTLKDLTDGDRFILSDKEQPDLLWSNMCGVITPGDSIMFIGVTVDQPHAIFSLYDPETQTIKPVNYWPEDGFSGNDITKHLLYAANSRLYTDTKGHYVYCTGTNRNSFIFTLANTDINIISRLYDRPIEYDVAPDNINFTYRPETEGLWMHANPHAIYTLLIDQDSDGNHADSFAKSQYGNIVQRFDWNGTLLASFSLDKHGCAIIVDEEDRNLYLQTIDPKTGEIGFVKYELNDKS